jgi:hypothetical protein
MRRDKPYYNAGYWISRKNKLVKELAIVEKYIRDHGLVSGAHSGRSTVWRNSVLDRDNHVCQMCQSSDKELHAHHVYPKIDFPELRYDSRNGVCLCFVCHTVNVHQLNDTCPAIESAKKILYKEAYQLVKKIMG